MCFKLARFIIFFAFATREAKCKQQNFTCYRMKIETSLEKIYIYIEVTPLPPPRISNPFWGGYGYFLELHIVSTAVSKS